MSSRLTETLSSRFSISLLTACALHVILLFGLVSSRAPANTPGSTLSVTLSTAPVRTAQTAQTLAIHNQRGDDSQSSPRPQLQSPAEAEQPARESAPQKTSQPEQAQTVTLARPSDSGRRRMATQPELSVAAAPQPETAFTPTLQRAYPKITFAYDWRFLPPASARKAPDQVGTPVNP